MDLDKLTNIINSGEIAVVPTDTVYGIIGDATNENVIRKVYEVKKRSYSKPLILMVSSLDMLARYVEVIDEVENKLIDKYWPGKLTILFKKNNQVSDLITSGNEFVGIRLPDNKELIELMKKLDKPLISTSCNISNKDVITSINMIENTISDKVSYLYDGGILSNTSSTVVKVDNSKIIFVREGELTPLINRDFGSDVK